MFRCDSGIFLSDDYGALDLETLYFKSNFRRGCSFRIVSPECITGKVERVLAVQLINFGKYLFPAFGR